ncbi:hypothetical protein M0765_023660 [Variovorax sp. S2]|jgi:hypothetical protein|uniref:hypothetical protein n=1 Tax=Variovorax sp. S12S4 TaxID=3029170 RepID=UPI00215BDF28|nr:hypothetical protein [Variovorax sp. S12S4]MCR8960615.1 hypothetical protein [Variovorax sp. S12S4]
MDEWLAGKFGYDGTAMRERGRELWWLGWTAAIFGVIPLIVIWSMVRLPRESMLAGLTSSIPGWAPAAAMALLYVGLMLAWAGWYIRRIGKRIRNGN